VVLTVAGGRSRAGVEAADDSGRGDAAFGSAIRPGDGVGLTGSRPTGCGPSAASLTVGPVSG
jgi:hypothetical protein